MDNRALFDALCARLGLQPDRRGEVHTTCPWCGKAPARDAYRGHVHFSFSERGGHCFVCGQSAGIGKLARLWDVLTEEEFKREYLGGWDRQPRPDTPSKEAFQRWRVWEDLAYRYAHHPLRIEKWQSYKHLEPEVIRHYSLGYGAWPEYTSQCRHNRLQVPLICWGRVVGFRGRAIECDHKRWLSPKGTRPVLYNGERLSGGPIKGSWLGYAAQDRRPTGGTLFIVENAIDALLLEQLGKNVSAVATLSTSYWQDDWTDLVATCGARTIFVAYDNDHPGNGGGERGRRAWLESHPRDITPAGVRLVNRLNKAGVKARLFPWPETAPLGMDMGRLLAKEAA